jgi:hypothetical protein
MGGLPTDAFVESLTLTRATATASAAARADARSRISWVDLRHALLEPLAQLAHEATCTVAYTAGTMALKSQY